MRIAYISAVQLPSRTASSIQVMRMCQAFARSGHAVTLYARKGTSAVKDVCGQYGVEACFEIVYCRWPPLWLLGRAVYSGDVLRALLTRPRPDLVYGRYLYALAAATLVGKPVVYEVHAPPSNRVKRAVEAWLFRSLRFRRLIAISGALRDEYLRLFRWLSEERVVIAPDGADVGAGSISQVSGQCGDDGRGFQAGYVGQLYAGKGMEVIVALAPRLPEIEFHVVGGMASDIASWKRRTKSDNVVFHGFVPHSAVPSLLDEFDVLLAPYQDQVAVAGGTGDVARWMSPLKIFEYMAAGKPIVCSDIPVLREVLRHQGNALLVTPNDIDGWVAALRSLRADPDLRARLAASARQECATKYRWEARAARVLE